MNAQALSPAAPATPVVISEPVKSPPTSSKAEITEKPGCFYYERVLAVPEAGTSVKLTCRFVGYPEVELGCHVGLVGKIVCRTTEDLDSLGLARLQKFSFERIMSEIEAIVKHRISWEGFLMGAGPRSHIFLSDNYYYTRPGSYVHTIVPRPGDRRWGSTWDGKFSAGFTFAMTNDFIERLIELAPTDPLKFGVVFQSTFARNICHGPDSSKCKSVIWQTPTSVRREAKTPTFKAGADKGSQGFSIYAPGINPEDVTPLV